MRRKDGLTRVEILSGRDIVNRLVVALLLLLLLQPLLVVLSLQQLQSLLLTALAVVHYLDLLSRPKIVLTFSSLLELAYPL